MAALPAVSFGTTLSFDAMQLRPSLLCSAVLSLLPFAVAQAPQSAVTTTEAEGQELRYTVGDVTIRRWSESGVMHAAMSRDAGRTWIQLEQQDDRLHFKLAQFDPISGEPQLPGMLAAPNGTRLFVVQFQTQVLGEYRAAVTRAGAEILHFLPSASLLVRGDAKAIAALRQQACVRWVGPLQNGCKLDVESTAFAQSKEGAREFNLVLAAKTDRATCAAQIGGLGGEVTALCDGSPMLRASLSPGQLVALLSHDTVVWADPATEAGVDMDNARIQGGGAYVETMAGFNGVGVIAEITEGFEETHPDFAGRVLVRGTNSVQSHGHCTAGCVAGSGAGNAAARGMMSLCSVIENGYYPTTTVHYANIIGSVSAASPTRSMQATSSWGSGQTPNYTAISQTVDDALFVADFVRTQSMSNLGTTSVRPEAWPKNTISVGGVSHGNNANPLDDTWTSASIGPAADGRLKPEICAYYENVLTSDRTSNAGYNTTAGVAGNYYTGFSGTSSATPIVNGHVGIIQEMFTNGLFGNPLPLPATPANRWQNRAHASTTKALLCNTAAQYAFSGVAHNLTRTHQGWGFPSLSRLYDNRNNIVVLDEYDSLQVGQSRSYLVWVAPGTVEFRATMVYSDPAAVALAAITLINNANLKVTRLSDGTFWWGNNGLDANNFSTSGGVPNARDTLEAVYLSAPAAGIYQVTVEATSIVQDGKVETPQLDLDYALVMHPVGGGYQTTGGLTVDLSSTGPGNLTFSASNVPAVGWTEGFTALSFSTTRGRGFGKFLGIEDDGLTVALWNTASGVNNPFHFPNSPGSYPFTSFVFPDPSLISLLAGVNVDGVMVLWNGGNIAAISNVDRLTLQ